jgi:nitrogen-specific signal transduction histidine kinase/DNA-binding response OmpR family regulator
MSQRQRILVVDDELGPREALRMMLKSRYQVQTVSGGTEALDAIRQTPPDLVFLDIKMRDMSGIEVLKAIKQIDARIEVVMMTAYASLDTARDAVAYKASDYLIKPFSKADVLKAVDKALAHRSEHAGSRQEMRALLAQMRALAQASASGGSTHDLAQIARVMLDQSKQVLHATAVLYYVTEDQERTLTCTLALDLPDTHTSAFEHTAWYDTLAQSLRQRVPFHISGHVVVPHQYELSQNLLAFGYEVGLGFPVLAGDDALGIVAFLYTSRHEVPADWRERGQTFAELMALTLRTHQRYAASQHEVSQQTQRVAQLSILREMSRVIMGNLGLQAMLQAIGEQLRTGLGYAGFAVWLCEPHTARLRQAYAGGRQSGWQPQTLERDVPAALHVTSEHGVHVVAAPIILDDHAIGVVEIVCDAQHGTITAFEVELLRMVLDYPGMAVCNAQLHEQLLQAEKLRALGEMAAGVAHNFNNILTTILGHAQLLLTYRGDAEGLHNGLTTIEKAAQDAAQMVRRIQTFSKGTIVSECVPTDLIQAVKEALDATRPVWKEQCERQGRCIEVALEIEPVAMVNSQPTELREVLTNLILNAVDAMPRGGTLTLRTHACERFGYVEVCDTGTGMSEDVQRRIFEPFFTTKKSKGTGLGLSVSHTLIKGHDGEIQVQTTPGRGTTFVVKLPLAAVSPPLPFPGEKDVHAEHQVGEGMCKDTRPQTTSAVEQ